MRRSRIRRNNIMNKTYTYHAFISYKREDERWAKWLQEKLEYFKLPVAIADSREEYLRPVFRDVTDLKPGFLSERIVEALDSSRYLIAICSTNYSKSQWCDAEVRRFIDSGRSKYIIPFIIDGVPYDSKLECFPPSIVELRGTENELLGTDVRPISAEYAFVQVVASMLDLQVDSLWKRYLRAEEKEKQRIKEQNELLLGMQSRIVAEKARTSMEHWPFDNEKAARVVMEVLPRNVQYPERPWIPEAESVLRDARKTLTFSLEVQDKGGIVCFSQDRIACTGKRGPIDLNAPSSDGDRSVRVYNYEGERLFSVFTDKYYFVHEFSSDGRYLLLADKDLLHVISSEDGTELCSYPCDGSRAVVRSDGRFIVIASDETIHVHDITVDKTFMLTGHISKVKSMAIYSNVNLLVSSASDGTVRLWNLAAMTCVNVIEYDNSASCAILSREGDVLISVHKSKDDRYNKVQFLDLRENRNKASVQLVGNQWSINTLGYDTDADYIFIEDTSGVFVFDKKSGVQVFSLHDCRHSKVAKQYRTITVVRNGNCIETYDFPSRQDLMNSYDGLLKSVLTEEEKYAFFLK